MKKNNEQIQAIALEILDYLETLEEGVEISTGEVIRRLYEGWTDRHVYVIKGDEYEDYELIRIHNAVKRNASKKGLKLDSSKYDDQIIGMPHNVGYVIKRCRKKTTALN